MVSFCQLETPIAGLCPPRNCSCAVIPYVYKVFCCEGVKNVALFKECWDILLLKWSNKAYRRFYSMDAETFLVLDRLIQRSTVEKFAMLNPDALLGLFFSRKIGKDKAVQ